MPLNVVLINPEIPWNTGNIGRTCVAVGATLHLVGKLGFKIESKEIRRAGLDYWPKLKWQLHEDFDALRGTIHQDASILFFSTKAKPLFWNAPYERNSFLVFGSESKGLPVPLHRRFKDRFYRIPIQSAARSLNLSTAAGIVLYEALRQTQQLGPARAYHQLQERSCHALMGRHSADGRFLRHTGSRHRCGAVDRRAVAELAECVVARALDPAGPRRKIDS